MNQNKYCDKVCFCCLSEQGIMKNMADELFESTILLNVPFIEGYTVCSGIVPEFESTKRICSDCQHRLTCSFEFRELCRDSYQKLKKKTDSIPDLYIEVKYEDQSDTKNEEVIPISKVFFKSDQMIDYAEAETKHRKSVKSKNVHSNIPDDVDASDLESEFVCFHCEIVVPTHREYVKHYEQHKRGNAYAPIHRICDICGEDTKRYTKHIIEQHKDYKPFKCKYCVKAYQTPGELKGHLKSHATTKFAIHECLTCHEKFKRRELLRTHIFLHKNPNEQYFCPFCGKSFSQFQALHLHFQALHDPQKAKNLFPCYQCKKIYMQRKIFNVHECAGASKPKNIECTVNCDRCLGKFSTQDEFVCHQFQILECRDPELYHCEPCNKTYETKRLLNNHNHKVHLRKQKIHMCDECGYSAVDECIFRVHKASHKTERDIKCFFPGCLSAFKHVMHLKAHSKVHETKPFECDLCKKCFINLPILRIHMAVHSDCSELRKYVCELCDKRFINSAAHLRHKLGHTGELNVKCQECPKKFPDVSAKNAHHKKDHLGIYYQCKYCDIIVREITQLKDHMFRHRGFKPYNCASCPMQYVHKPLFKRHLLKQHNIVFDVKIHGYVEKDDLTALVKECERKNYGALNLPPTKKTEPKRVMKRNSTTDHEEPAFA